MAEKPTNDDTQTQKDFLSGFEGPDAAPATAEAPKETTETKPDSKPEAKAEAPPPKKTEAKAEKPKAPEYVQITKEQFDRFEAAAVKTAEYQKQFDKAFGSIGKMQQVMNQLQGATAKGEPIKLTRAIVAKLEKDFPELADGQFDALEQLVKLINQSGGRGTGDEPVTEKPKEEAPKSDAKTDGEPDPKKIAQAAEILADFYPDWKKIVGAVGKDEQPDPNNPFRKWLSTRSQAYQDLINTTSDPHEIRLSIDRFKAYEAEQKAAQPKKPEEKAPKPNPQTEARREQLREAVNPRGSGTEPTRQKSAEDYLKEGFGGD